MSAPEWPLWPGDSSTSAPPSRCPQCGEPNAPSAAFCESCGAAVTPTEPPSSSAPSGEISGQTRRLGARHSSALNCSSCGGTIDADGYCTTCGTKAPSARDHFRISAADWVGGVCDRGVHHARNEDALALWAQADRAVAVVCDGVSSSIDADAAATTAAETISSALIATLDALPSADATIDLSTAFVEALAVANRAVIEVTAAESTNAASATVATAVVLGAEAQFANLGDSRVYFISGSDGVLLSVDDSMAQAFIAEGMDRGEAESLPRAHAITKWLGRDAVDIVPRVGRYRPAEPGWIVVCSDGLWNYASQPTALAAQIAAISARTTDPTEIAAGLVAWANEQGGRDNITVALVRCPAPMTATTLEADSSMVEERAGHG